MYVRTTGLIVVLAVFVAAGCKGEPEKPRKPSRAAVLPKAPPPKVDSRPKNLDSFGNLKESDERIEGFHIPMGAQMKGQGPSVQALYVPTTEKRLLRFYRSRGYDLTDTVTGWRIAHTDRTLKGLDDPEIFKTSLGSVRQGPGPGYTLSILSGTPRELKKPALMELLEAESKGEVAAREETKPDARAPEAPEAPGAAEPAKKKSRVRTKQLERFSIQRLKTKALGRKPLDPSKARDVSKRVYDWVKAKKGREFKD